MLRFRRGYVSHEVRRAGKFTEDTPQVKIRGWAQGAILEVGNGRVAVFGEAAMFTAQRSAAGRRLGLADRGAPYNQQFLLNAMHWLTRTP